MSRSGEKEEGALLRALRASDWAAAEALLSRWRKAEGGGGSRSAGGRTDETNPNAAAAEDAAEDAGRRFPVAAQDPASPPPPPPGPLVLHVACRNGAPASVIDPLLAAMGGAGGGAAAAAGTPDLDAGDGRGEGAGGGGGGGAPLPLHLAASAGASPAALRSLVGAHPAACLVCDGSGDLPVHRLWRRWARGGARAGAGSEQEEEEEAVAQAAEVLLGPLCTGEAEVRAGSLQGTTSHFRRLFRLRPENDGDLGASVRAARNVLEDGTGGGRAVAMAEAKAEAEAEAGSGDSRAGACSRPSSDSAHLPLHIAAELGLSAGTLLGLCLSHPEAAAVRLGSPGRASLELFEGGRAGRQAAEAAKLSRRSGDVVASAAFGMLLASPPREDEAGRLGRVLDGFHRRSDLLFAFHPMAERAAPASGGARRGGRGRGRRRGSLGPYRHDPARLARIEATIRAEVLDAEASGGGTEGTQLSVATERLWDWLCGASAEAEDGRTGAVRATVGRILEGLGPTSLWRLSLGFGPHRVITLDGGRTVPEEALRRRPSATFDGLLRSSRSGLSSVLLSFLGPGDALAYSSSCRRTRASGVRWLREMDVGEPDGIFQFDTSVDGGLISPLPWQPLPLIAARCTHTVCVTYDLEVGHGIDGGKSGGLLVVRDDLESKVNRSEPWGDAVLASDQLPTSKLGRFPPASSGEAMLTFSHNSENPGISYSLWSYGTLSKEGVPRSVAVSNVRVRQLVYASILEGGSPLHMYLSSFSDGGQMLPSTIMLRRHLRALLSAGFENRGNVLLHHALKCGAPEKVLRALIAERPSTLMEADREGRTALHAVFLLCETEPPSVGVIKALLTTPGENAAAQKDDHNRLPIHIACERGASFPILKLLVAAYSDSCYRVNRDGDLPVHLLVRSGSATTQTVELLIDPVCRNETICMMGGSIGTRLPLHIAAEYTCSYKLLERLLLTYPAAAKVPRTTPLPSANKGDMDASENMYALDLFEAERNAQGGIDYHQLNDSSFVAKSVLGGSKPYSDADGGSEFIIEAIEEISLVKGAENGSSRGEKVKRRGSFGHISCASIESRPSRDAAAHDLLIADFDLRSDLIFSYAPYVPRKGKLRFREEPYRIQRLRNLIRREAVQIAEDKGSMRKAFSEMARFAFCFMCTCTDPDHEDGVFLEDVEAILRGLSTSAINALANIPNPHSNETPHIAVKDSAAPGIAQLLKSRIRFVGRFILEEGHYVHRSDSCMVIRGKDHIAADSYAKVKKILDCYNADRDTHEQDIHDSFEDLNEDDIGSITHGTTVDKFVLDQAFIAFAKKAGVDEQSAEKEMKRRLESLANQSGLDLAPNDHDGSADVSEFGNDKSLDNTNLSSKRTKLHAQELLKIFNEFCDAHLFNSDGTRDVCIKFIRHRSRFMRELESRSRLNLSGENWSVPPVLVHYDVDRIHEKKKLSDTSMSTQGSVLDEKDKLYFQHILEKNAELESFSLYKYAIVLPGGDSDLEGIARHEDLTIVQIRDFIQQVASSLQNLHEANVIHGDLKAANVVRFGRRLALVDLDSACDISPSSHTHVDYLGGSNHNFSTGTLPPEMIEKIDLEADRHLLADFEEYYRDIIDDFNDLNLLNPDDVHQIDSTIKVLLGRSDAAKNMGSDTKSLRQHMGEPLVGLEDPSRTWKDVISGALVCIRFSDLPDSLSSCQTLRDFAVTWQRLKSSRDLWNKICPRSSNCGRFAYILKTFDERVLKAGINPDQSGILPYNLVEASPHTDIWALGLLLYSLCSGGNLFHVGFHDDLRSFSAYAADLYGWTKESADSIVRSNVDDPLAQDLLSKILVPKHERLNTVKDVLRHPFFADSSELEAQRILERYEEERLLAEETIFIATEAANSTRRLQQGSESPCKIIFEEQRLTCPTAIVVLPFELPNKEDGHPMLSESDWVNIKQVVSIGKSLLEINLAVARLTFWSKMKENLGGEFKRSLKMWLKRARSESCVDVAVDILQSIGCGSEFMSICKEMLEKGDSISNARAFIKSPMDAASKAIHKSTEELLKCYDESQYVYILDEFHGVPSLFAAQSSLEHDDCEPSQYPIPIDPNANLMQPLLLHFMIITSMAALSRGKLRGLGDMLGLPLSEAVPNEWRQFEGFLIHTPAGVVSISEFGVLLDLVRKKEWRTEQEIMRTRENISTGGSIASQPTMSSTDTKQEKEDRGSEMRQLEVFYREYDPQRNFSGLYRVADGSACNCQAIWTNVEIVEELEKEVEVAEAQARIVELRQEYLRWRELQNEIDDLTARVIELQDAPTKLNQEFYKQEQRESIGLPADATPLISRDEHPGRRRMEFQRSGSIGHTSVSQRSLMSGASSILSEKRKKMRNTNRGRAKLRIPKLPQSVSQKIGLNM